jgi:transposase-like protein
MPRQKYSATFKVKAVLEALKYPDGISAYCRRKGISDVLWYRWQSQMINNASNLFEKTPQAAKSKINRLESELAKKDRVIAAVTEEALELKKKLMD